jgi:hypothetical protein
LLGHPHSLVGPTEVGEDYDEEHRERKAFHVLLLQKRAHGTIVGRKGADRRAGYPHLLSGIALPVFNRQSVQLGFLLGINVQISGRKSICGTRASSRSSCQFCGQGKAA